MADASPELLFHGSEPADDRPIRRVPWLAAALVASLACVLVLAALFYREQRRDTAERPVLDVVRAYTAAWDAHDLSGVRATITDQTTFVSGESLHAPLIEPVEGAELESLLTRSFRADAALKTTGPATVTADAKAFRVTLPQRLSYVVQGLPVTEDGVSLFTVVRSDGQLRIAQHFWWRPYAGENPSLLWAG